MSKEGPKDSFEAVSYTHLDVYKRQVLVNQLSPGAIQVASGVSTAQSTLATGASALSNGLSTYTGAVSTLSLIHI